MRIIAGSLRSRRLHAPPGNQTRPTHDRVKEALFSILGDLREKSVVDLYAGTGALGIEALSRGASHACFVERSRSALECIRRNLDELNLLEASTILARSVESSAGDLRRLGPYDLVFCDPPWTDVADVLVSLDKLTPCTWLTSNALLLLEHPAKFPPPRTALPSMIVVDQRAWGDTGVTFYRAGWSGEAHDESRRS